MTCSVDEVLHAPTEHHEAILKALCGELAGKEVCDTEQQDWILDEKRGGGIGRKNASPGEKS